MEYDELFSRSELLMGREAMQRLAAKKVILFGVGGVGSWCAEGLIRSGVMHLTMVDPDRVAVSNINRQLPATTQTVGQFEGGGAEAATGRDQPAGHHRRHS